VVNIIIKKPDEHENEFTFSYGSNNTFAVDASYAATKGEFKFVSALRYFDTNDCGFAATLTGGTVFSDSAASQSPGLIATARFNGFYAATAYGKAEQFTIRGNQATSIVSQANNEKFFLDLGFDHTFENN